MEEQLKKVQEELKVNKETLEGFNGVIDNASDTFKTGLKAPEASNTYGLEIDLKDSQIKKLLLTDDLKRI